MPAHRSESPDPLAPAPDAPRAAIDLASVRDAELRAILGYLSPREFARIIAARGGQAEDTAEAVRKQSERWKNKLPDIQPWGIALSGGGIRSATFALGVLQTLARQGLLTAFHYQSTVSGGGYAGALLQGLIRRRGLDGARAAMAAKTGAGRDVEGGGGRRGVEPAPADAEARLAFERAPVRHLREYSNYLAPHKSPFSGDTLGMVGTYVRNVLLVQTQLCALILGLGLLPWLLYAATISITARWPGVLPIVAAVAGVGAVLLLRQVSESMTPRDLAAAGSPTASHAEATPPPTSLVASAIGVIVLLAVASYVGAMGLAAGGGLPGWLDGLFDALLPSWTPDWRLGWTTACLYAAAWLAWFAYEIWFKAGEPADTMPSPLRQHPWRFLLALLIAAVFARYAITAARSLLLAMTNGGPLWHAMSVGPIVTMAAVTLTGIVQVGIAGPALSDQQREIWARVGGKTAALVVLGIGLTLLLTIYGPWAFARLGGSDWTSWRGWTGVLTWAGTTGLGLLTAHGKRSGDAGARGGNRLLGMAALVAPWVFLIGLLVLLSVAGQALVDATLRHHDLLPAAPCPPSRMAESACYLQRLDTIATARWPVVLALAAAAFGFWGLLGWAVNANEFSLNAFYRNRLVRCYLGASNDRRNPEPTTNFDIRDDLFLADVIDRPDDGQEPTFDRRNRARPLFPLVCTTLNLVATKQLDWQDRKGASFVLSPLFCGHLPPDSRPGGRAIGDVALRVPSGRAMQANGVLEAPAPPPAPRDAKTLSETLSLGGAIAISGAAVNPNMGYHSSPAVTFLLTLFDARLGWWLPNLAHPGPSTVPDAGLFARAWNALRDSVRPKPGDTPFFGHWLVSELLGRTDDGGAYVHLSDGGHFENLGLYELVRRRCRFVLCVDAAADPQREFADLGNAVHKCRVDFGAEIDVDVSPLSPGADGLAERSCAVGRITYADDSTATLLYLKPTLTGKEPSDIQHYAAAHAAFPHEPTADQYFDEAQFESYRRLGEDVAERALRPALERVDLAVLQGGGTLDFDAPGRPRLVRALAHLWAPSLGAAGALSTRHGEALARLFETMRSTPALSILDAQIYPAWTDVVSREWLPHGDLLTPIERRTRLPEPEDFRTCFYFCQSLIRLMESVYHDLEFERDWNHPDHRGWINLFRHWTGSPIFRVAWTLGVPTFGARFVAFSEQRFDVPRFDNNVRGLHALQVEILAFPAGAGWRDACQAMLLDGGINHVEHAMLVSQAITRASPADKLILLKLRWNAIVPRDDVQIRDSTLGVMALSGTTIRLMRVQQRMQRMGLGSEFLRLALAADAPGPGRGKNEILEVDIAAGDYGRAGRLHAQQALELDKRLRAMLARGKLI